MRVGQLLQLTSHVSAITVWVIVILKQVSLRAFVSPDIRYSSRMCFSDKSSTKKKHHKDAAAPLVHLCVLKENLKKSKHQLITFGRGCAR